MATSEFLIAVLALSRLQQPHTHLRTFCATRAPATMATVEIPIYSLELTITAHLLTPDNFAPFGEVIQNPRPDVHPSKFADAGRLPFDAISANQGTAIQYQHVTHMVNKYDQAPSGAPGGPVMSMFVCAARQLQSQRPGRPGKGPGSASYFEVNILERHPYTTQTFTPLSASGSKVSDGQQCYLVIVAPNVKAASAPQSQTVESPVASPPDLLGLKAFVATTNQAVTYGAGTWHAPMVALGPEGSALDFVVTQFKNGVGSEDCQIVTFGTSADGSVCVEVPIPSNASKSKL
ncbi:hypothetical protein N0V93_000702 [Gnomoniopsis smithogilvyi]|uniref:Ureidoglycolate hydrolase n=1 Tax=Gnomoniopsis smithogilvyi TaxID=1191159 RepID=A0A9W9D0Y9_9PEZI|nr:hypothetical protein N0V93_000702 [Gnomoniopsis smithogilvyi]